MGDRQAPIPGPKRRPRRVAGTLHPEGHLAHPVLEIIARLRSALPVLSPREALAAVITACNIPDKVVRWSTDSERTRSRLANLEALLELAEQYEDLCLSGQHAASISGLILWLAETAGKRRTCWLKQVLTRSKS